MTGAFNPFAGPEIFGSTAQLIGLGDSNTYTIFVTVQGLTSPTGSTPLVNTFTSNSVTSGWTITEQTFYDPANGIFSPAIPIGSAKTFTTFDTAQLFVSASFAGTYSITELYTIVTDGSGSVLGTINLATDTTAAPLPAALPLFAFGLGALALLGWRRKRKNEPTLT